jgi:hypothetical protein
MSGAHLFLRPVDNQGEFFLEFLLALVNFGILSIKNPGILFIPNTPTHNNDYLHCKGQS